MTNISLVLSYILVSNIHMEDICYVYGYNHASPFV